MSKSVKIKLLLKDICQIQISRRANNKMAEDGERPSRLAAGEIHGNGHISTGMSRGLSFTQSISIFSNFYK